MSGTGPAYDVGGIRDSNDRNGASLLATYPNHEPVEESAAILAEIWVRKCFRVRSFASQHYLSAVQASKSVIGNSSS